MKIHENHRGNCECISSRILSLEAMRRLCRKAGAGRVSKLAAKELANILEEVGAEIAKGAIEFTLYAGRRTVKAKDIKAAYKNIQIQEPCH